MKVDSIKTPLVRKAMKRAQQIAKNPLSKKLCGYVPIGRGKFVFIAGGPEIDKKVAKANKKLLCNSKDSINTESAKVNKPFFNVRPKNAGGYVPIGNGKSVFIAGGAEIDKKVEEANKKLLQELK